MCVSAGHFGVVVSASSNFGWLRLRLCAFHDELLKSMKTRAVGSIPPPSPLYDHSSQVSKWRLQFKEAEARLLELTGDKTGDMKRVVWGLADEERFRGELDEKVGPPERDRANAVTFVNYYI